VKAGVEGAGEVAKGAGEKVLGAAVIFQTCSLPLYRSRKSSSSPNPSSSRHISQSEKIKFFLFFI
jgi:hypothetical protein